MKIKRIELRMVKTEVNLDTIKITSPNDAFKIANEFIADKDKEYFMTLFLDVKNKVNALEFTSIGSLNSSIVHPREVFKTAVLSNAASIIIAHNHPSGDLKPSNEDIKITKRLYECGKILGIHVIDHIVVGWDNEDYISFHREGLIL